MSGGSGRVGAIWAEDQAGILGADGGMLWRVPADFKHFKAATLGGVVIMGRTTWDSIGPALPGRRSLVLTRRAGWSAQGAVPVADLGEALALAPSLLPELGSDPRLGEYRELPRIWIIGGGSVYRQALEAGCVDDLVISTLDIDAAAAAQARGIAAHLLVHAPMIADGEWRHDPQASDPLGSWRERSGDARWRVDAYRHAAASAAN